MNFLHHIIRQIKSIKFAFDWKEQNRLAGAKKFKTKFIQSIFADQIRSALPLVFSTSKEEANFKKFKIQLNCMVTMCMYLFELYCKVHVCIFILFYSHFIFHVLTVQDSGAIGSNMGHRLIINFNEDLLESFQRDYCFSSWFAMHS